MARVLQVVTELVVGGASLTMLDFAEDLAAEHDVQIAHGRLIGPENAALRRARERFATYELPQLGRPLSAREDAAAIRDFHALCRLVEPDVIHTHSSKAGFIGRIGAPHQTGRLFHTVHGWGHTPRDTRLRRSALVNAERLAARRTTKLIAVSPEVKAEGLALGIGRAQQYAVIGAAVDMSPRAASFNVACAEARLKLGIPRDVEVVGWVGRFSAQKDPWTLAEVVSRLLSERPNAYAVLIGDGPDRGFVEKRLRPQIRARRALMTGERADARSLYPAFDVLIHTTLWEGHPRVVREALAERVPVVSARVSGTTEIAGDARLGALVPAGEAQAFVAALSAILGSRERSAPIDDAALAPLRAAAGEPYRLMRELYRTSEQTCSN
ncbi:MAG TPA: glycosyltransferase [Solirubrobacteraceae bacterium]|jgi:glycosyltransferase involved in cell wall biosynthesis|nr:glycosyltransferase [Solirubrobacteraceae bacterium]